MLLGDPTREGLPWAARQQKVVEGIDWSMRTAARRRHQNATWWWGQRQTETGYGAVCYLCDTLIATWARKWPMTQEARRLVEEHRECECERTRQELLGASLAGGARTEAKEAQWKHRRPEPPDGPVT